MCLCLFLHVCLDVVSESCHRGHLMVSGDTEGNVACQLHLIVCISVNTVLTKWYRQRNHTITEKENEGVHLHNLNPSVRRVREREAKHKCVFAYCSKNSITMEWFIYIRHCPHPTAQNTWKPQLHWSAFIRWSALVLNCWTCQIDTTWHFVCFWGKGLHSSSPSCLVVYIGWTILREDAKHKVLSKIIDVPETLHQLLL